MDTAPPPVHPGLPVRYFDGRSSRPRDAQAVLEEGRLHLKGPDVDRTIEAPSPTA